MRWMVLIPGLLLSGCVAYYGPSHQGPPPLMATSMAQVDAMVGPQQPAAYRVGFMEGCDSGRLSAGDSSYLYKKDTNRFNTDDVYKQGWSDGFNRCTSEAPVTTGNYYYPSYYGYYYPSYYYAPGYSIWLGYYGYSHHNHYGHRHNYYYTPWYGGHKHKGGHSRHYSSRGGHKRYGGNHYIGKHRGGGHRGEGRGH